MANPVKVKARVTEVVRHADGVASYCFEPQGRVPKFGAGQFLHLALDEYCPQSQWPESRVFSIASAPSTRHKELGITVTVKGRYTERICQELDEGAECWLKLPYGEFIFPPDTDLALVAGGVGITPYLSLLKQMLEQGSDQSVTLYYGFRSPQHYLFSDLLDTCREKLPGFRVELYCEEPMYGAHSGIIDVDAVVGESSPETLFYLSGPPAMIDCFKTELGARQVAVDRIRVDDWE